jgi:hypothetical protein
MHRHLWLFLSAFGIMFVLLSWAQDAKLIPPLDGVKGLLALAFAFPLQYFVGEKA